MRDLLKKQTIRRLARALLPALLVLCLAGPAISAITAGYTWFYIPGPTNDILSIFDNIDENNAGGDYLNETDGLVSVINIVASGDNTTVYYDHYEDGYDLDEDDPESTYDEKYTLDAGDVLTFQENSIDTSPTVKHDGGDRIFVVGPSVSVSRAAWPGMEWSGPSLALDWEIYPVKPFLTDYTIPVGEDLYYDGAYHSEYRDFEMVYALIMSVADDNTVQVDDPANPGVELTVTLQRGETIVYGGDLYGKSPAYVPSYPDPYRSDSLTDIVNAGIHFKGTKPIQVQFVAATTRGKYECRGFNVVPDSLWDNEYYNPVTSTSSANTDLFIYNPNQSAILIEYRDGNGSGSFAIPARSTQSYYLGTADAEGTGRYVPTGTGVYLKSDSIFWGIGAADTNSTTFDWGYTLIPKSFLSDQYYIGWAPGCSTLYRCLNGSPVYVAAVYDGTKVYVDYNNDNTTFDHAFTLNSLEGAKLRDSDYVPYDLDNTGMEIWTDGLPLVVVWGEDPDVAGDSSPYLDLGASTLPMPSDWMDLVLGIDVTVNPGILPPASGELVQFTLTVSTYDFPVSSIAVENILPTDFVYVPYDSGNPTQSGAVITLPDGTQITGSSADPSGATGSTLTWTNAILQGLDMDSDETLTITFWAESDAVLDLSTIYTDKAQASGGRLEGTHVFSPFDYAAINVAVLTIDKDQVDSAQVQAGGTAVYAIRVENIATDSATDVRVTDTLSKGFTYAAMITTNGGISGAPTTAIGSDGRQTLTWDSADIGNISAGTEVLIEFQVDVAANAAPGTHDNTAQVTFDYNDGTTAYNDLEVDDLGDVAQDAGTPADEDPETDEDVTVMSLTIDKETSTPVVAAGETASYQVILENLGADPVTGLILTDNIPDGFSYDSGTACIWVGTGETPDPLTCTYTVNPTIDGQELTWNLSTIIAGDWPSGLPADYKAVVSYDTTVATDTAPGTYSSTALAYSDQTGWIDDSGSAGWKPDEVATCTDTIYDQHTPVCDEAYDEDVEVRSAVLTIDLDTTTPTAVNADSWWGTANDTNAVYTISVVNTGTATATGVDISQALPAGFTWDQNVSIVLTDATGSTTVVPTNTSGTTWLWNGDWSIAPGGSVLITFEADVNGAAAGTYDSTAYADYDQNPSGSAIDDIGTDDQDADTPATQDPEEDEDVTIVTTPTVDLGVSISHTGVFAVDEQGTFLIDVGNNGPSDIASGNGVVVTVTLPTGMTYVSGSLTGTGWVETDGTGQTLTFTYDGGLDAGDSLPQLTIGVIPSDSQTYTVTAAVDNEYNIADSNSANDSDTDEVTVTVLAVAKEALTPAPWYPGDTVTYKVTVTNNSSETLTNVTIADTLPAGMTYKAGSTVATVPIYKSFLDQFNSVSFGGNDGTNNWTGDWGELGENNGVTSEEITVREDPAYYISEYYVLKLENHSRGVYREANLSGATAATLSFDYHGYGMDDVADEYVSVSMSNDGGSTWVELDQLGGSAINNSYAFYSASYDILDYLTAPLSSQVQVRFQNTYSVDNNDRFLLDNVQISAQMGTETRANASGATIPLNNGTPANLITTGDAVNLGPGGTLTVTFDVTIDSDTEPGSVTNTAAVTADGLGTDNVSVTNKIRSMPTVAFYDIDGNLLTDGGTNYTGQVRVQVTDPDHNIDPNEIDTITVTITSVGSGDDPITVTLYETGPDTGVFAYSSADYTNKPYYTIPLFSCDPPVLVKDGGCVADAFGDLLPDDDEALYVPSGTNLNLSVLYDDSDAEAIAADQATASISMATWVMLSDFSACTDGSGGSVIQWSTAAQVGTVGFYLLRQDEAEGEFQQVNDVFLPAVPLAARGADYRFVDSGAVAGKTYRYKLKEIDAFGRNSTYGPYEVTVAGTCEESMDKNSGGYIAEAHAKAEEPVIVMRTFSTFSALMTTASQTETESGEEIKITVSQPGLYYVSASDIDALLTDVSDASELIAAGGLALTSQGKSVSWTAADDNSGIYFYGTGIDTLYTKNNVYWLKTGNGLVMSSVDTPADVDGQGSVDIDDARQALKIMTNLRPDGVRNNYSASADTNANTRVDAAEALYALQAASGLRPSAGPDPAAEGQSFADTVHGEEDLINIKGFLDDADVDFWYWKHFLVNVVYPFLNVSSHDLTLSTPGAAGTGSASITASFQGVDDYQGISGMHHHVQIYVNGDNLIGEVAWNGNRAQTLTASFNASLLNDGTNTITVKAVLDDGIYGSLFYLDEVDLTYPRYYQAKKDALICSAGGHEVVTVTGFSGNGLKVYDITEPLTPGLVTATTINGAGSDFSVSFTPNSETNDYLTAFPGSQLAGVDWAPDTMVAVTRSGLTDSDNSVDYLVITPESMAAQAQTLADYRASEAGGSFDTKVALVEDIYDQFNHGILNPKAIRTFLSFAWHYWKKAPSYVVLVGRGTYDWDDDTLSPIPMETADGLFASDNWYADVANDDGVPEMAIGRLPVTTGAELSNLITKITAYEAQADANWNQRVLMVAGPDNDGEDFEPDADAVAALLPSPYSANLQKLYVNDLATPEADLVAALNQGALLFNFMGHGNSAVMANQAGTTTFFTIADAASLTNGSMAPVVVGLTCLINWFDVPDADPALGEEFLTNTAGGAIAVWGPTGLSQSTNAVELNKYFVQKMFESQDPRLGDVVRQALKRYGGATGDTTMPGVYILLGDPGLSLPVSVDSGVD